MLRGSLRVGTPRMSMQSIMSRGFWTGNVTSTVCKRDEGGVEDRGARAIAVMELIETESQYCGDDSAPHHIDCTMLLSLDMPPDPP